MTDKPEVKAKKIVKGIVLRLDEPSKYTGNIYPKEVIAKAVEDVRTKIAEKRMIGQYGFPVDGQGLSPANVTHIVSGLEVVDKDLIGEIELLDTPKGRLVVDILKSGHARLGVSGTGATEVVNGRSVVRQFSISSVSIILEQDQYKPVSCSWESPKPEIPEPKRGFKDKLKALFKRKK